MSIFSNSPWSCSFSLFCAFSSYLLQPTTWVSRNFIPSFPCLQLKRTRWPSSMKRSLSFATSEVFSRISSSLSRTRSRRRRTRSRVDAGQRTNCCYGRNKDSWAILAISLSLYQSIHLSFCLSLSLSVSVSSSDAAPPVKNLSILLRNFSLLIVLYLFPSLFSRPSSLCSPETVFSYSVSLNHL